MTKYLAYLELLFEDLIDPPEIPSLRDAVMDFIGWDKEFISMDASFGSPNAPAPFSYPVVQFKVRREEEGFRPVLTAVGHNVGKITRFLRKTQNIGAVVQNKYYRLAVSSGKLSRYFLRASPYTRPYRVVKYHPMDKATYTGYFQKLSPDLQVEFLRGLLIRDVTTFADGIGWRPQYPVHVEDVRIRGLQSIRRRRTDYPCFKLDLRCNLTLPDGIGLGNGVAKGLGVVRP